ncbi:hypothetical protein V8E36_005978 [Tilletia maclaganii]
MVQPIFAPISNIHEALHAFHVTAHDRNQVTSAYHYCACMPSHKNSQGFALPSQGMRQCLIYSGASPDAKLIGVEWLLNETDFLALPEDEKRFWHSHQHEIESGLLCALGVGGLVGAVAGGVATALPSSLNPGGGIPDAVERAYLEPLLKMYGKIWHFYDDPATQAVPLGVPTLMMSTTDTHPSLVSPTDPMHRLLKERDAELGINSEAKAAERAKWVPEVRARLDEEAAKEEKAGPRAVVGGGIAPGADLWEKTGRVPRLVAEETEVKMETVA